MDGEHELARFSSHEMGPAAAPEWLHGADSFSDACGALLAMGLAVRVSAVGYGRALRLGVTDNRGWAAGWTLGSGDELQGLIRGLLAPGAQEYIERQLERPKGRR